MQGVAAEDGGAAEIRLKADRIANEGGSFMITSVEVGFGGHSQRFW